MDKNVELWFAKGWSSYNYGGLNTAEPIASKADISL